MKWSIHNKRFDMTDLMVNIEFTPENKPLRYFLSGIDLVRYPKLLDSIYNRNSYFQPLMSLKFYKDLDWEDLQELKDIKEDEIVIYHEVYGDDIVKESIFCQVLLDYSVKLLEVYRNDLTLSVQWGDEMQNGINQLRRMLESQS